MGWSHLSTSIDPSDTSPPALVLLLIRIHPRVGFKAIRIPENRGIEDRYELKPPRLENSEFAESSRWCISTLYYERKGEKKEKENLLEFSTSKDATMIRVFEEISWPSGKEKNLIFLL